MEHNDDDGFSNRSRASDMERIKQARKKRIVQLKNWFQYDKMLEKQRMRNLKPLRLQEFTKKVHFPESMVVLEAAGREDVEEVKRLLSGGASPDVCNEDGLTALHQCCIDNSLKICQLLLQFGANVNATDSEMWTPLHAAAACAHIDICACLIDHGANLLALNAEGNMPYDICEEENTLDLIENAMASRGISQEEIDDKRKEPELQMLHDLQELKLKHGNLAAIDEQGASFLHIAASCGYLEVGRFLVEHDVPVKILDKDGWQPIHVASCWGQLEFIEFLLIRGADIDSTTNSGETVYEVCEDPEINRKLHELKLEMARKIEVKKSLQVRPSLSTLGRRSNSHKRRSSSPEENTVSSGHLVVGSLRRTASIRRSSMKDKSLMSWKEARQEALIREVVEQKIAEPKTDSAIDNNFSASRKVIHENETDNVEQIDMNQVMLDVQARSQKEAFVRRGSSRNSFTHAHPYHSPSRDLSLLGDSVREETIIDGVNNSEKPIARPEITSSIRNSHRKHITPKSDSYQLEPIISNRPNVNYTDSPFVRTSESSRLSQRTDKSVTNNSSRRKDNRKEMEIVPPLIKPQKTQGCCVVM